MYGWGGEVVETSLFGGILSVFYFLNSLIPFLKGTEIAVDFY